MILFCSVDILSSLFLYCMRSMRWLTIRLHPVGLVGIARCRVKIEVSEKCRNSFAS